MCTFLWGILKIIIYSRGQPEIPGIRKRKFQRENQYKWKSLGMNMYEYVITKAKCTLKLINHMKTQKYFCYTFIYLFIWGFKSNTYKITSGSTQVSSLATEIEWGISVVLVTYTDNNPMSLFNTAHIYSHLG